MIDKDFISAIKEYGYTPIIFFICLGFFYQMNEERRDHLKELEISRKEYIDSIRDITKSLDGFNVRLYNIEQKIGG
ncbi:MAG: hypothetical protein ACRDDH_09315 [Cetobacterium sp.]|uniref:hypothetical protein n=1 Tax=Cetobacterium sp. TaxID=2071632 RepID=UPI003EE432AF